MSNSEEDEDQLKDECQRLRRNMRAAFGASIEEMLNNPKLESPEFHHHHPEFYFKKGVAESNSFNLNLAI